MGALQYEKAEVAEMEQAIGGRKKAPARRGWVIAGLIGLQVMLMGAAYVGGKMMSPQGRRGGPGAAGMGGGMQLPSQLPKDPSAGMGSVLKIASNVITLSKSGQGGGPSGGGAPGGGPGGAPGGGGSSSSSSSSGIDVTVTAETKYYKSTGGGSQGMPGGADTQSTISVQDATLADVKVGSMLIVWGLKTGDKITADTVYIQAAMGGGPGM